MSVSFFFNKQPDKLRIFDMCIFHVALLQKCAPLIFGKTRVRIFHSKREAGWNAWRQPQAVSIAWQQTAIITWENHLSPGSEASKKEKRTVKEKVFLSVESDIKYDCNLFYPALWYLVR